MTSISFEMQKAIFEMNFWKQQAKPLIYLEKKKY